MRRWNRNYSGTQTTPTIRVLSESQKNETLDYLNYEIRLSPVLTALKFKVKFARGRFYYDRIYSNSVMDTIARITPIESNNKCYILEAKNRKGKWFSVTSGSIKSINDSLCFDEDGTFHGLGQLNRSLREKEIGKKTALGLENEVYFENDKSIKLSLHEILAFHFKVPINIIAEPIEWNIYHRKPEVKELDHLNSSILVDFTSSSIVGNDFKGTCLYTKVHDQWNCFKIKPSQSETIELSINWLKKRKWVGW